MVEELQARIEKLEHELENHTHPVIGSRCYYSHQQEPHPCETLPLKKAKIIRVREEFEREYVRSMSYRDYVRWCKLTERGSVEWIDRGRPGTVEEVIEALRQAGEDPEEEYLMVGLERFLPEDLDFPKVYKGVKVFARIVDEKGVI